MEIKQMLLTPNPYSRPQIKLTKVEYIVVHYVGNPNTSALANRNYFENLRISRDRYVSSHYLVGLQGEVLQCVPDNEVSYCSNSYNNRCISIETCHPKADGVFNDSTYASLCELCAMLLKKFNLTTDSLIRHFDVTGKQCPLHWSPTKYQSEAVATARWNRFKQDVQTVMNGGKVTRNNTVDITESSIKNNQNTTNTSNTTSLPYKVKVIDDYLNVRKDAGLNYPVVCTIKKNEVYTIIEEKQIKNKDGSIATWGRLKSKVGWLNVGSKYVKKVK